ncbi:hypothetical protein OMES3154_00829 [Oceanivirga miroungae]|uniref:Uncharacterized protein n=1 Tax=Oceanivirga miroungae TaxID=1130046 RepID=A0A6I8MDL6_9FUSO|nr:hypothetical protein OMES3154_00829 [Oceanivirga miroungae]
MFLTLVSLILFATILLRLNHSVSKKNHILKNEILNTSLTNDENLIYSELKNFAFSYEFLKDTSSLSIDDLKDEFIEPFYSQNEVEKSYSWELKKDKDHVIYIGRSKKNSDFLLVFENDTNEYNIYYEKNITKLNDFHRYKKVISYTGKEYIERGKGK